MIKSTSNIHIDLNRNEITTVLTTKYSNKERAKYLVLGIWKVIKSIFGESSSASIDFTIFKSGRKIELIQNPKSEQLLQYHGQKNIKIQNFFGEYKFKISKKLLFNLPEGNYEVIYFATSRVDYEIGNRSNVNDFLNKNSNKFPTYGFGITPPILMDNKKRIKKKFNELGWAKSIVFINSSYKMKVLNCKINKKFIENFKRR